MARNKLGRLDNTHRHAPPLATTARPQRLVRYAGRARGAAGSAQCVRAVMALKPVSHHAVQLGEPLPWPVFDKSGKLLLKQGAIIATEALLQGILARGMLDDSASATQRSDAPRSDEETRARATIFDRIRDLERELAGLHRELGSEQPRSDLPRRMLDLTERLLQTCRTETDATLAVLQLDALESGLIARLLHAAVLCELTGRAAGLDASDRLRLCAAAVTYDIGLSEVNEALNRQKGELTHAQKLHVRCHPANGVSCLQHAGIDDPLWLDAVMNHHERIDGSGYPRGLHGDAVALPAKILAIADIYSAMVRPRAYRDAIHSRNALRDIFLERGKLVDGSLAAVFIKELGIYPPGTFVKLANSEIAIVTHRSINAAVPTIRCIINRDGSPAIRPAPRDAQASDTAIVDIVSAHNYRSVLGGLQTLWEG